MQSQAELWQRPVAAPSVLALFFQLEVSLWPRVRRAKTDIVFPNESTHVHQAVLGAGARIGLAAAKGLYV